VRLTDSGRERVLSLPPSLARSLARGRIPSAAREDYAQEAWLAVCRAAARWRRRWGVPWEGYAAFCARRAVRRAASREALRARLAGPPGGRAAGESLLSARDFRRHAPGDPLLALWFDPDYRAQRRRLRVRVRVVLYLIAVEGWTVAAVADLWGVTRRAVDKLREEAVRGLAAARREAKGRVVA
jgi:DNA-directed RNA polymerase specialized sigma24 family protein